MKATQVSKENGVVKFNIEFSVEEFKDAINKAYLANRSKFQIDGFRKGKAPRKIIESHYGHDIFWDEALNELLDKGYYDALKEMDYSYFYTCGPEPMLKAVYKASVTSGQMSFEERMGCGFGACMGCSCKTLTGYKRICKDGPVMMKEEILWEN